MVAARSTLVSTFKRPVSRCWGMRVLWWTNLQSKVRHQCKVSTPGSADIGSVTRWVGGCGSLHISGMAPERSLGRSLEGPDWHPGPWSEGLELSQGCLSIHCKEVSGSDLSGPDLKGTDQHDSQWIPRQTGLLSDSTTRV